ncbi:MAG: DNA primase [Eubacterium sp.]|nr:DNA primase [Eubacterium sp.]
MPGINNDFIEEVRSRNDIVDVISGYIKLTRRGSNYFGLCPFHGEKTASFSVSPGKQMFYCFGCGKGGNVFNFVMEYENFTFMEAVGTLAERAGLEMPKIEYDEKAKKEADLKSRILEVNKDAANYFFMQLKGKNGEIARNYFDKRQLSEETIKKFGLGYSLQYSDDLYRYLKEKGYSDELLKESGLCVFDEKRGGHDKFWNRVMFPILDVTGHVIGFGGRVMGEGMPKYMNSPETKVFDKSRNLYGLNVARQSRRGNLILCEGYMDVISLHQAGFTNAAASLGTALTAGHARLISRYFKEVLLCYDSDNAGTKAAFRAVPILKEAGISAKVINMKPYKDPDEFIKNLGSEEFEKRIGEAQNSFLFEISAIERNYDLSDPKGKTDFIEDAANRLTVFTDEIERNNYIDTIAQKYSIDAEALKRKVNSIGLREGIVADNTPVKIDRQKSINPEEGFMRSQNLLLTWLVEDRTLYESVKKYILPSDFEGELYIDVAGRLYGQMEKGEPNPAKIITDFTENENQGKVAEMFNGAVFDDMTEADRKKALKETIVKMKQRAIDKKTKELDPADIKGLTQIIEDKKALQKLESLAI